MGNFEGWSREDLIGKIRFLEREVNKLTDENRELREDKEHYRFRVENELEPRIKSERQAYDNYVTDPSRHGGE